MTTEDAPGGSGGLFLGELGAGFVRVTSTVVLHAHRFKQPDVTVRQTTVEGREKTANKRAIFSLHFLSFLHFSSKEDRKRHPKFRKNRSVSPRNTGFCRAHKQAPCVDDT